MSEISPGSADCLPRGLSPRTGQKGGPGDKVVRTEKVQEDASADLCDEPVTEAELALPSIQTFCCW